jgi:5'-3' exonuclease
MKLLLIDANNLGIRQAFSGNSLGVALNTAIEHPDDFDPNDRFPTGVLHGFFQSLLALRRQFNDYYFAVVWDGGHAYRTKLTQKAVALKMVPNEYKASRKKGEVPDEIRNFLKQKPELMRALTFTNIPQVLINNEEADDAVASYVQRYRSTCEHILIVTEDKDYYQLLAPNVSIYRQNRVMTEQDFINTFQIAPWQWVEVCALSGDDGDDIFGIPGWGETTSLKAIQTYGTVKNFYRELNKKHGDLLAKFPDLQPEQLVKLAAYKTPKGKLRYAWIGAHTEYTGVAVAFEEEQAKISRTELAALMFQDVVGLAWVLKRMRLFTVADLPGLGSVPPFNRQCQSQFLDFCWKFHLRTIAENATDICAPQTINAQNCMTSNDNLLDDPQSV